MCRNSLIHRFFFKSFTRLMVLLSLFSSIKPSLCQEPQFSQFYAASLYLNPAFTGNTDRHRLISIYRNQWVSIPKAFISYSFSYDYNMAELNSGVGLIFTRDIAGTGGLQYTSIGGLYSYYFKINKKLVVKAGLMASYNTRNYNQSKSVFADQIVRGNAPSSIESSIPEGVSYMDFGAGGLIYNEKFWAGVSLSHLNTPNQSLLNETAILPIKYSVHGGYKIFLKEGVIEEDDESISLAYQYKAQEKWDQFDVGGYYKKKMLTFGVWYRGIPLLKAYKSGYANNDAVVLLVGMYAKTLRIGYSYDITISKMYRDSGGSHEISLSYEFPQKRRKKKVFFVPCAKF